MTRQEQKIDNNRGTYGCTDVVWTRRFDIDMWCEVFGGRVMTIEASRIFGVLMKKSRDVGNIVGSIENFDVMNVRRHGGLDSLNWGTVDTIDNGQAYYLYGCGLAISRRHVYDMFCDSMDRYFVSNGGLNGLDVKKVLMNVEMILNRSSRALPWLLTWGGDEMIGLDKLLANVNGCNEMPFLRREL